MIRNSQSHSWLLFARQLWFRIHTQITLQSTIIVITIQLPTVSTPALIINIVHVLVLTHTVRQLAWRWRWCFANTQQTLVLVQNGPIFTKTKWFDCNNFCIHGHAIHRYAELQEQLGGSTLYNSWANRGPSFLSRRHYKYSPSCLSHSR